MALGVIGMLGACRRPATEVDEPLSGSFPLVRFNEKTIPATIGLVAEKDTVPHCPLVVSNGSLALSVSGGFAVAYTTVNGCNQQSLGTTSVSGMFTQSGNQLALQVIATDTVFSYFGVISEETIRLVFGPLETLDFSR